MMDVNVNKQYCQKDNPPKGIPKYVLLPFFYGLPHYHKSNLVGSIVQVLNLPKLELGYTQVWQKFGPQNTGPQIFTTTTCIGKIVSVSCVCIELITYSTFTTFKCNTRRCQHANSLHLQEKEEYSGQHSLTSHLAHMPSTAKQVAWLCKFAGWWLDHCRCTKYY